MPREHEVRVLHVKHSSGPHRSSSSSSSSTATTTDTIRPPQTPQPPPPPPQPPQQQRQHDLSSASVKGHRTSFMDMPDAPAGTTGVRCCRSGMARTSTVSLSPSNTLDHHTCHKKKDDEGWGKANTGQWAITIGMIRSSISTVIIAKHREGCLLVAQGSTVLHAGEAKKIPRTHTNASSLAHT